MSDIFREVDEEVRQDKAIAFWNKYQLWFLVVAVLIVLGSAGWKYWQSQQIKAAETANEQFQTALTLSREGKPQEAEQAFQALARSGAKGYATLAAMRAAAELAGHDKAAAVKAYDALANDPANDTLFRDNARLRAAMLRIDEADRREMENRLSPLAAAGAPFRSSARELLALAAIRADDFDAAGRWLDQIVTDNDAPPELKRRADAFLGLVRSDRPAK